MTEEERRKLKIEFLEMPIIAHQVCAESFVAAVKNAFADNKYPGDDNLIADLKHRAECKECRDIYDRIIGKSWKECLKNKYYGTLCNGQSFFKPPAWHYYLPAYLIQCVRHKDFSSLYFSPLEESDFEIDELGEGGFDRFWEEWEQPRTDLLSPEQCAVIVSYLETVFVIWQNFDYQNESNHKALNFWRKIYSQKRIAQQSSQQ